MANFDVAVNKVLNFEGGFQQLANDSGNYVNGVLIGTNKGISAKFYYTVYKKVPTIADIKNLTTKEAKNLYKIYFWDKNNFDLLKNQSVTELIFDILINSGSGLISNIKEVANLVARKNVLIINDLPLTKMDINFINSLNQQVFFEALKKFRENFYYKLVATKPNLNQFLKGWINRLNKHIYKDDSGNISNTNTALITALVFIIFGGLFVNRN